MAKRILTSLRLDKIAAVDRPCQEHATMTIMKRAEPHAGNPAGDHVDKKENSMSDDAKKVADLEKSVADLTEKLAKAEADKAVSDSLAKMSDKEKEWHDKLKDDAAKKAFRDLSAAERASTITKAAADDEILKVDGNEIRKSEVGAGAFGIMKSQQAALEQQAKDLAKAEDARVTAELQKRADDEFGHVVGTLDERTAMLKAIVGIKDEAVRKSLEAALGQAEKMAKQAFETRGTSGGQFSPDVKKAATDFMAKADEIEARDKCSKSEALSKARTQFPDLYKAYREAA